MVDDDPPIKTGVASKAYRDNFDRIFGEPEPTYPCAECGKLRTKAAGGTTFTVCDDCWEEPTDTLTPRDALRIGTWMGK